MATEGLVVENLAALDRAFRGVSKDMQKGLREELRVVAEPVRFDAERLAQQSITRIGPMRPRSWARMRVGVTRTLVYVAPRQKSRLTRTNPPRYQRRRFADKLRDQAMQPALAGNEAKIIARVELLFDIIRRNNGF